MDWKNQIQQQQANRRNLLSILNPITRPSKRLVGISRVFVGCIVLHNLQIVQ